MSAVSDLLKQHTVPQKTSAKEERPRSAVSALLSAAGAAVRGAAEAALPTALGLGTSAAVLAAVPTGGASLLAIPAGLAAGFGASRAQDVFLRKVLPAQRQAFLEQRSSDIREHPISSTVGEFVPALLTLRPSVPRSFANLRLSGISGAVQGGIETGAEAIQGEGFSPSRIATSTLLGTSLTKPTRLGAKLFPTAKPALPADVSIAPPEPAPHVQRVIDAIKEAKPIRRKQEVLFTEERGKRIQDVLRVREELVGEVGFRAELSRLKGELPKAQFEGIRSNVTQADIDAMFNDVNFSSLDIWDQLSAKSGLAKLL